MDDYAEIHRSPSALPDQLHGWQQLYRRQGNTQSDHKQDGKEISPGGHLGRTPKGSARSVYEDIQQGVQPNLSVPCEKLNRNGHGPSRQHTPTGTASETSQPIEDDGHPRY